ncbi:collagen alpha-1(xii) chain [Plakobranchus ocellatus]|uniref:Collagen alpha-1(Xii) chain n=1 Tax=Plakobranchus ocellatus TaxID=259542 RepID=A0AAV3YDX7_9GAST|nr:collagen alpha-1(xii) chain [Plakobranchus ocellatus]
MVSSLIRLLLLSTVVIAIFSSTVQAQPPQELRESCKEPSDIIFVLDTSSSIYPPYFNINVKKFIRDVVLNFNIGPGPKDTRIGAMVFSTKAHLEFDLNEYDNADDIIDAVQNITFRGGSTFTHLALEFVAKHMLSPEHGSREGVAKLVIIVTDGRSRDALKTLDAADDVKAMGADIVAIGVGRGVYFNELNMMASLPSNQFVFQVSDFRVLDSILERFSKSTCVALKAVSSRPKTTTTTPTTTTTTTTPTTTTTTTTPTTTSTTSTTTTTTTTTTTSTTTTTTPTTTSTTTTTTMPPTTPKSPMNLRTRKTPEAPQGDASFGCEGKPTDIYFLLDASTSVWVIHFHERVLPFVRDIVSQFQISPLHTRVGLVTFSNDVNHEFGLTEYSNLQDLLLAIQPDEIEHLTGGTQTGDAIQYIIDEGFKKNETRPDVTRIIITVTDGLSQQPRETAEAAAEAKFKGVVMFAVGVGKYVDQKELSAISSNPDEDFTFHVDDYIGLSSLPEKLAQKTCKAVSLRLKDQPECGTKPADIMFVYDSYKPVVAIQAILGDLINTFAIDASIVAPETKIGVLTQPCVGGYTPIQTSIDLSTGLKRVISSLRSTGMHALVKKLRLEVIPGLIARRDRQAIAILVLDESFQDLHLLKPEVRMMKTNDVKIIVVAVGNVPEQVIWSLASQPMENHVIRVDSYENLKENNINPLNVLCGFGQVKKRNLKYDIDVKYFNRDQAINIQTTAGWQRTKPIPSAATPVRVTKVSIRSGVPKSTMQPVAVENGIERKTTYEASPTSSIHAEVTTNVPTTYVASYGKTVENEGTTNLPTTYDYEASSEKKIYNEGTTNLLTTYDYEASSEKKIDTEGKTSLPTTYEASPGKEVNTEGTSLPTNYETSSGKEVDTDGTTNLPTTYKASYVDTEEATNIPTTYNFEASSVKEVNTDGTTNLPTTYKASYGGKVDTEEATNIPTTYDFEASSVKEVDTEGTTNLPISYEASSEKAVDTDDTTKFPTTTMVESQTDDSLKLTTVLKNEISVKLDNFSPSKPTSRESDLQLSTKAEESNEILSSEHVTSKITSENLEHLTNPMTTQMTNTKYDEHEHTNNQINNKTEVPLEQISEKTPMAEENTPSATEDNMEGVTTYFMSESSEANTHDIGEMITSSSDLEEIMVNSNGEEEGAMNEKEKDNNEEKNGEDNFDMSGDVPLFPEDIQSLSGINPSSDEGNIDDAWHGQDEDDESNFPDSDEYKFLPIPIYRPV